MIATLRTLKVLSEYRASIVPCARREIGRWGAAAAAIPDPTLRRHATEAIALDASNAEAASAFAALAPRRHRRTAVELLVAYQMLVDHVDVLGERLYGDDLAQGLTIGTALTAAIATPAAPLPLDPFGEDGGYIAALVATCRTRLWRLPSAAAVATPAEIAALRCAQALAYTHAAGAAGIVDGLRGWAAAESGTAGYAWWEIAAGGNSNLAVLALLAAATDPRTTCDDATAIASVYWPHVCVMSTLFDSLVDYESDAAGTNFSFVSHYRDAIATGEGLTNASRLSLASVEPLRHSHIHTMIVCGVAAYYTAFAARGSLAAEIAPSVIAQLGRQATPIVLALRGRSRRAQGIRPVRSRTAAFLTRSRGSVRGPGGSGSSATNCDGTGDFD